MTARLDRLDSRAFLAGGSAAPRGPAIEAIEVLAEVPSSPRTAARREEIGC